MGELQNQQVGAEQDDRQNREAQSNAHEHPATAQVRAMLSSQDPQAIGEIIRNNPEARSEIYALLHKSLGNQFVTQVEQFVSGGNGARGKPGTFNPAELRNIIDGDGSALDKKPADAAQAKGKRGTFTSDELRNIIDGDGTALDRKAAAPAAAQAPGNPSKFTPDELRNIIDGDGSALDKKQPEGPAPLPAPTSDLTSTVTAPPTGEIAKAYELAPQPDQPQVQPMYLRGQLVDKKQSEAPAPLPAPTPDLTSTVTAPPTGEMAKAYEMELQPDQPQVQPLERTDVPTEDAAAAKKPEAKWVTGARRYNRAHAAEVAEFLQATGNACVDESTGEADPYKVARWQADHGVPPDGRVGEQTLTAAILDFREPTVARADGTPKSS